MTKSPSSNIIISMTSIMNVCMIIHVINMIILINT